jgi:hypothetical protein
VHTVPRIAETEVREPWRRIRAYALIHKKFLRLAIWSIVILLLGRAIAYGWQGLETHTLRLDWEPLAISILLLLAAFINGAFGWHLILRTVGVKRPLIADMAVWLTSQAAKYLPAGTVWYLGSRFVAGKADGLDGVTISFALGLELLYYLAGALALFGLSLATWPGIAWGSSVSLGVLSVLAMWCIGASRFLTLIQGWSARQGRWASRMTESLGRVSSTSFRWLPFFYLTQWMIIGAAFWGLVTAVYPVKGTETLALGGAFGFASATGYLAFFIPGGWGVREVVLGSLLEHLVPIPLGAAIAILARLWYTGVEGLAIGLGYGLSRLSDMLTRKDY